MSEYKKDNLILNLTFQFSLKAIDFSEVLYEKKRYRIADQVFGSCTAIGANVKEAQNSRTKNEFISKMKIAAQEADEAEYWLLLCKESKHYPDTTELLNELTSIMKVLNKIISSSSKETTLEN
jgi:four helix bundle protein